jgi:GC-rich sequence DNA-binding factor
MCVLNANSISEEIQRNVATVFDDVVEEFHQLSHIKARFDRWQEREKASYDEAYIGLCLPKLFTPLVNAELISWNPLEVGKHCLTILFNHYETIVFL